MKLQKATKREIRHISVGCAILGASMLLVFAVLRKLTFPVLLGTVLGCAVAVGNFTYIGISVQRAVAAGDKKSAARILRSSYSMRLLLLFVWGALGMTLSCLHPVAAIVPLLFPRATIFGMQLLGMYDPNADKPTEKED